MSNSTSSDRLGQWDEDSNRPHKKRKYSQTRSETNVIEDDADSSRKRNRSILRKPESDSWVVARCLGSDSNASVYLALRTTEDGEDDLPSRMAIKSNEISESAYLMIEEKFLTRLKGQYIVSCYGHEITEEKNEKKKYFNTILEYCPGQTLEKQIKSHREGLPIDDVKRFASDILRGLKCIHGEEIIHRDIKPKNILLKPLNSLFAKYGYNNAKISGLGNALEKKRIDDGENWNHTSGTARFMSPELIGDKVLDYGADVWAFGCTVLEMLTGQRVWGEYDDLDWQSWVTVIAKSGLAPNIPDYLSEEAKDFLTKCLERDPAKRWSVDSLINHEFLYDEVEAEIEADEANLHAVAAFQQEEEEEEEVEEEVVEEEEEIGGGREEAIEIDEEYPNDDSEEEDSEEEDPEEEDSEEEDPEEDPEEEDEFEIFM